MMPNDSKSLKEWFWLIWSKIWWLFFIVLAAGIFYLGSKNPGQLFKLFSIVFTICGIGTILYGARTRRLQQQSLSWAPAKGVILSSEVKKETRTSHVGSQLSTITFYRPCVKYDYEYQGKNYQSRRIIVANINWPKKEAEEAIERYPVNANVTVWVNPVRPKIAVLERGMIGKSKKYLMVYLVGAIFLCVAIITWSIAMFIFR